MSAADAGLDNDRASCDALRAAFVVVSAIRQSACHHKCAPIVHVPYAGRMPYCRPDTWLVPTTHACTSNTAGSFSIGAPILPIHYGMSTPYQVPVPVHVYSYYRYVAMYGMLYYVLQ